MIDKGEISIESCNEMNIPVRCFMIEPEENGTFWTWTALCFQPRRECCVAGFLLEGTKEEIQEAINKYVVPLYEIALDNLKNGCNNYYWEKNKNLSEGR
jgi:hypothetical protein